MSEDIHVVPLDEWESPASHYPRLRSGQAEIGTAIYDEGFFNCYMTRPLGNKRRYTYFRVERDLSITELLIDGKTWMVDDPPHWWGMQEHAEEFHGHLICAGLGLGLIIHAANANPDIESITIIERNRDVIDLIGPLVPDCEIIEADWYEYRPDREFNSVLYDLYVGDGAQLQYDAMREILELRRRFPGAICRIHGMSNDSLNQFADDTEIAVAEAQKLVGFTIQIL